MIHVDLQNVTCSPTVTLKAVSYTHLDVYKRQVLIRAVKICIVHNCFVSLLKLMLVCLNTHIVEHELHEFLPLLYTL